MVGVGGEGLTLSYAHPGHTGGGGGYSGGGIGDFKKGSWHK